MKRLISYLSLLLGFSLVVVLGLSACGAAGSKQSSDQADSGLPGDRHKLKVVATTSIVADIVAQIGGKAIELTVLLPPGTDPHTFDPTPQDIAKVAEAEVVFASGVGLEEFLEPLVESANAKSKVLHVSDGVALLQFEGEPDREDRLDSNDPHTWTDPNNVLIWVGNVEQTLSRLDPENAAVYEMNAERYKRELHALDAWIKQQVDQVPAEFRKIITDHRVLAYFADRYGFIQLGAIVPGYSTLAEPSAQDLAAIEDAIKVYDVKAVFVGNTVNPNLAQRIADDTGIQIVFLYTGSLTTAGGEADTYLEYVRYNVSAIVNALK